MIHSAHGIGLQDAVLLREIGLGEGLLSNEKRQQVQCNLGMRALHQTSRRGENVCMYVHEQG